MKDGMKDWESRLVGDPLRTGGFSKETKAKVRERIREKREGAGRRLWFGAAAVMCCSAMLLGYLFREDMGLTAARGEEQPAVIRAVIEDSLEEFGEVTLIVQDYHPGGSAGMRRYTQTFTVEHPSVEVKVIGPTENDQIWDADGYRAFIEREQPDVLRVPFPIYIELAREGMLTPIESLMKEDRFGAEQFYEPVIDLLREAGGGELYGLATEYKTNAVYMNPELFEEHGVPLPEGPLTWEELLQTAAGFQGSGVYGLVTQKPNEPLALALEMGRTEGLQLTNPDGTKVSVSGKAWEAIWNRVATGIDQGYVFSREPGDVLEAPYQMVEAYKRDPFMTGEAAMRVASSGYAADLLYAASMWKNLTVDWTAIPEPVQAGRRTLSSSLTLNDVYAIPAQSTRREAAWAFLKHIASERMASRTNDDLMISALSARADLNGVSPISDRQLRAFTALEVDPARAVRDAALELDPARSEVKAMYMKIGNPLLQAVMGDRITVPEALAELQGGMEEAVASLRMKEVQ